MSGCYSLSMTTVFRTYFAVNGMQSNLVLCIGAAVVLAAFGGQATVRIGGLIMAGVAAVALGLFIYLQQSSPKLYLLGRIHGFDSVTYQSLDISCQRNSILGRLVVKPTNPKRADYDFVIFKQQIHSNIVTVSLPWKDRLEERELRVRTSDFAWAFGDYQRLEWELREEGRGPESILTLFDLNKGKTIACEGEMIIGTSATAWNLHSIKVINYAFAKDGSATNVTLILETLKAHDTPTRRGARDALSQVPADQIPVIMNTLRREISNYRVKLGVCVALAQMLRSDKTKAETISSKLTVNDINLLLDAAGDSDRTVRVYASEFLFDLGDMRTTKLAIPRAARTKDDNARYNWLFVSQEGWNKLSSEEKAELVAPLNEAKQDSGPKTLQLFDKLQI
ncbi:uncharacterized protein Dvar_80770 [Desulfosarcina variabilis str. Montpellier]